MDFIIYKRTSPSGKVYIGQTSESLEKRAGPGGVYYSDSPLLYRAILKYGWSNFKSEILEVVHTKAEADEREAMYIQLYSSYDSDFGYNLTLGGNGGVPNEETRRKLSECKIGKPSPCKGRHLRTEEQKENLRVKNTGKHHSDATKKRLSEKFSGSNNPMFGRKHSEETRAKMRKARAQRKVSTV